MAAMTLKGQGEPEPSSQKIGFLHAAVADLPSIALAQAGTSSPISSKSKRAGRKKWTTSSN
eukprot:2104740-Rhodomonas_salina.1